MWADSTRVRVLGPLLDSSPGAFVGHWIQIVDGVGVGQSRKIVAYRQMPGLRVEFTIDRPWEVVPFDGSEIVVTRQFWHSYIVDNEIDIRGCQKQNPNWRKSGEITIWAQNSDSAIEGNVQYQSDGIKIFAGHSHYEPPPAPTHPRCRAGCISPISSTCGRTPSSTITTTTSATSSRTAVSRGFR